MVKTRFKFFSTRTSKYSHIRAMSSLEKEIDDWVESNNAICHDKILKVNVVDEGESEIIFCIEYYRVSKKELMLEKK